VACSALTPGVSQNEKSALEMRQDKTHCAAALIEEAGRTSFLSPEPPFFQLLYTLNIVAAIDKEEMVWA
jgi:hypothetical protein